MKLPVLTPKVIETDPYRSVVLINGACILAECNGSGKQEVADEIARRCNTFEELLNALKQLLVWDDGNLPGDLMEAASEAVRKAEGQP